MGQKNAEPHYKARVNPLCKEFQLLQLSYYPAGCGRIFGDALTAAGNSHSILRLWNAPAIRHSASGCAAEEVARCLQNPNKTRAVTNCNGNCRRRRFLRSYGLEAALPAKSRGRNEIPPEHAPTSATSTLFGADAGRVRESARSTIPSNIGISESGGSGC